MLSSTLRVTECADENCIHCDEDVSQCDPGGCRPAHGLHRRGPAGLCSGAAMAMILS